MRRIQELTGSWSPGSTPGSFLVGQTTGAEYVYGPGGAGSTSGYVDEFIFQSPLWGGVPQQGGAGAGSGPPQYVLQDANYNVVALVDDEGETLAQYTYDPYGDRIVSEHAPGITEDCAAGFQGLFFDTLGEHPLTGEPLALYHARNRDLRSFLGRFLQKDPNETGLPLLTAAASWGQTFSTSISGFDLLAHYGEGANLFVFAGANPITSGDPLGLYEDPFAEVDDIIAELTGHKLRARGDQRGRQVGRAGAEHGAGYRGVATGRRRVPVGLGAGQWPGRLLGVDECRGHGRVAASR